MINYLNNIALNKNILLNSTHKTSYDFNKLNFYQLILNECKKNLLNKEIKFDNIFTKKKKKNNEDIISINFIVHNLLNILNKYNIENNCYKKNINTKKQKKKSVKNINLKDFNYLKSKEKNSIEKNKKIHQIFKNNETFKNLIHIKNKNCLFFNYNTINISKKSFNKSIFNKTSNLNMIKNKQSFIKDNKNFIYFKNHISSTSSAFLSKHTNKDQHIVYGINSIKKFNKNNFSKLNKKPIFTLNDKTNIQWKKAISQQVLLCIANKENKAEIHLKPEFLGTIYIKITMKNDQARLKFISDQKEIKNFLNCCIPYLQDSLIKNGIFLKKVDIFSSSNIKENKNLFILQDTPVISSDIKNFVKNVTEKKNIDVYV